MNKFKRTSTVLIATVFLFLMNCNDSAKHSSPEEKEALKTSKAWLSLIDEGHYDQSWQMTTPSIKNNISERQWIIGLEQIRAPMGKIETRSVISFKMGGSNSQKNFTIGFSTIFRDQNSVKEYVTVQIDDNHEWRVSAYYIDR